MATYNLTSGQIGAYAKTLAANTVDTINFPLSHETIEVWADGTAAVYFTVDGSTPTVAGAATYEIPAGGPAVRDVLVPGASATQVQIISAGTPKYSVTGTGGI